MNGDSEHSLAAPVVGRVAGGGEAVCSGYKSPLVITAHYTSVIATGSWQHVGRALLS